MGTTVPPPRDRAHRLIARNALKLSRATLLSWRYVFDATAYRLPPLSGSHQYGSTAALRRQVKLPTDVRVRRDGLEHLAGKNRHADGSCSHVIQQSDMRYRRRKNIDER